MVLIGKAFKRGQVRDFPTCLLDRITDPISHTHTGLMPTPTIPGRRRLHPILVSGLVCFGLMFVMFLYFSYWR